MQRKLAEREDRRVLVVAKYGTYEECKIRYPSPRPDDDIVHDGWRCVWCSTVFECDDIEEVPDHRCLGPEDGIRVTRE